MTGATGSARLERRYRQLLACYPRQHRATYDDEMIGVLMSAAAPDQRRPETREAVNLIASGLRARLRLARWVPDSPAWRDGLHVFGYLASVLIAAMAGYLRVVHLTPGPHNYLPRAAIPTAIGWALVATATALRRYRLAAAGATIGALATTIAETIRYGDDPVQWVTSWWRLVITITVAGALLALARRAQTPAADDRPRPLGISSTIAIPAAALLVAFTPLIESWTVVDHDPNGSFEELRPPMLSLNESVLGNGVPTLIAGLLLLVTLATVVLRLAPSIRRRVILLSAPAVLTALLVWQTFNGFVQSSSRFMTPVYLVAPQWIGLIGTPVVVFALGVWLLGRYERKLVSGALLA